MACINVISYSTFHSNDNLVENIYVVCSDITSQKKHNRMTNQDHETDYAEGFFFSAALNEFALALFVFSHSVVWVQMLNDTQRQVATVWYSSSRSQHFLTSRFLLVRQTKRTKRWKKNSFYFHSITHVVFCFVTTICWSERRFAHNACHCCCSVLPSNFPPFFSLLHYHNATECPRWRCAVRIQLFPAELIRLGAHSIF